MPDFFKVTFLSDYISKSLVRYLKQCNSEVKPLLSFILFRQISRLNIFKKITI